MSGVCVRRVTLQSRRAMLNPRVAPRGWWTPKNPNALSALSTRPPYSERTPLPPGLASPCFHPSFCVPFRCDYRLSRPPPPPTSPSFLSCHHLCLHLKTTRSAAANQQPLVCSLFSTSTHFIATGRLYQPSSSCQPSLFQPASHLLPTLCTFLLAVISPSVFSDKTFFLMLFLLC